MTITDNRTEALEALQKIQDFAAVIVVTRGYGQEAYDLCEVVRKQVTENNGIVSEKNLINEMVEVLKLVDRCYGFMLLSDPPKDSWTYHQVSQKVTEVLKKYKEKSK